jgi:hypothetical protein
VLTKAVYTPRARGFPAMNEISSSTVPDRHTLFGSERAYSPAA